MKSLNRKDVIRVIWSLPIEIKNIAKTDSVIVAGGFIRAIVAKEPISDIDLFGDKETLEAIAGDRESENCCKIFRTDRSITLIDWLKHPIQLVIGFPHSDPVKLIESFDFTICQACVYWDKTNEKWHSLCSDDFYFDLAAKRLHYTEQGVPPASLLRVKKFIKKGYTISAQELAVIVAGIIKEIKWGKVQPTDYDRVKQLLIGIMNELDPNIAEWALENEVEDIDVN